MPLQPVALHTKATGGLPGGPRPVVALQRARGVARVAVRADGPATRLFENYQSGAAKMRFPRHLPEAPLEVVLINTSGGVTGGDHLQHAASAGANARCIVVSQAAERIYRRSTGVARIETKLSVAEGASLDWLPQETILFDRSALSRTLDAEVAPDGRLLAVESIVLGRAAMGEKAESVTLSDSWRVRRGGKLVFADGLRLDGDATKIMANGATGGSAGAVATLLFVAPNAETHLETARSALASTEGEGGASAWNGMLVARLIARSAKALRSDLIRLIEALRGTTMPRVWHC
jgi:urease accessory protein